MKQAALFFLVATAIHLSGCGSSRAEKEPSTAGSASFTLGDGELLAAGPVVVRGTTIDAASGQPIAGVFVEGPGGTQATSDRHGRFELRGLPLGLAGTLIATTGDGRRGQNRLRPLKSGALEVVVFLR